jgi:hypothetical protein
MAAGRSAGANSSSPLPVRIVRDGTRAAEGAMTFLVDTDNPGWRAVR